MFCFILSLPAPRLTCICLVFVDRAAYLLGLLLNVQEHLFCFNRNASYSVISQDQFWVLICEYFQTNIRYFHSCFRPLLMGNVSVLFFLILTLGLEISMHMLVNFMIVSGTSYVLQPLPDIFPVYAILCLAEI